MGNESSTQSFHRIRPSAFQDASSGFKKGILLRWKKRRLKAPIFGVVRHAERADGVYSFFEGGRWTATEDFSQWPLDPPLSDAGHTQADGLGDHIKAFAAGKGSEFHVVISSPYLRCIQTAARICKRLGPDVKMLVDQSIGEVYGPSVMGEVQPHCQVRAFAEAEKYCRSLGVDVVRCAIGSPPAWPETLKDARTRYALRFLSYLQRLAVAKRNFLLVTHGDCLGTVFGILPDQKDRRVHKVEYGGTVLASRPSKYATTSPRGSTSSCGMSPMQQRANTTGSYSSVLPVSQEEPPQPASSAEELRLGLLQDVQDSLPGLLEAGDAIQVSSDPGAESLMPQIDESHSFRTAHRRLSLHSETSAAADPAKHIEEEKAMLGWKCETFNIEFMQKRSSISKYGKKLSELLKKGAYTRKKMEDLLGELGDLPLGDSSTQHHAAGPQRDRSRNSTHQSTLSLSTYLFGGSDRGDLDEPPSPRTPSPLGSPSTPRPFDLQHHSHSADRNRLQPPSAAPQGSWSAFSGGLSPREARRRRASHHRRMGRDRTVSLDLTGSLHSPLQLSQDSEHSPPARTQSGQVSQLGPRQRRAISLTAGDALAKAAATPEDALAAEASAYNLGSAGAASSLQQGSVVHVPGAPQFSQVAQAQQPSAPVASPPSQIDTLEARAAPNLKTPTMQGMEQSSLMQRRLARLAPIGC